MIDNNDWRLIKGQIEYLKDKRLIYCKYLKKSNEWEHDHCEFCNSKFSEYKNDLHYGYCTEDKYHWICEKCFEDFKEMFNWKVDK